MPKKSSSLKVSQHQIQLQLSDTEGFPVAGTQFWITLDIVILGPQVTIHVPLINFQTGQPSGRFPVTGGYLYTSDGFLPENIRPADIVNQSYLVASNNGPTLPHDLVTPLPTPPSGYILQVTHAGGIVVQSAGTFGNNILAGPQVLLPTSITYLVKRQDKLKKNFIIGPGFTNTTLFTGAALNVSLRDSHVNDAFAGVIANAWSDNSNIDPTLNTLNVMVAIGKIEDGKPKFGAPIQLTNLAPGFFAADTAVAINRLSPNNIVVSWGTFDNNNLFKGNPIGQPYRAVSTDGGKTWPINGLLNILPTGNPSSLGDVRGVSADKFGNIWYNYTNLFDNAGNIINVPTFLASNDGVNFTTVYTAPLPSAIPVPARSNYDYPQYCFGGDGSGNYGLRFVTKMDVPTDVSMTTGFIPILGQGSFNAGATTFAWLDKLVGTNFGPDVTSSLDGRVWFAGVADAFRLSSYISPDVVTFKSPGAINVNYAGSWDYGIVNNISRVYSSNDQISQPNGRGYFSNSTHTCIYDDTRQALYVAISAQIPDSGQDMQIYLRISRNNGQSWSTPLRVATTKFANRGFHSMALDTATGDLLFGFYDGRNDPTLKTDTIFWSYYPC